MLSIPVLSETRNRKRSSDPVSRCEDPALNARIGIDNGTALAKRMALFVLRNELKVAGIQIARLNRINQSSVKPVTSPQSGVVVSVTSYGQRLKTVHLTLESIASGSLLPSRLILWVDTEEAIANPSTQLRRLIDRGLELRLSQNFGPHTKYYPYLLTTESFACPLVTADDDQLYPQWWLEGLFRAYREDSLSINCFRAHRIAMSDDGMAPYESWKPCRNAASSYLHFATGVSGVVYPPSFLNHLKSAGSEFLALCPKQDDAWLHVQALRAQMPVRQVYGRPLRFPIIPGSQSAGLFHTNVLREENDIYLKNTYCPSDLALLRACAGRKE